ncbi:MAG: hypothetical protein Q9222_007176 [Ikaeria aurantiellina]
MSLEDIDPSNGLDPLNGCFLSLIVPQNEVKKVKHKLEINGLLDKNLKITPFARHNALRPAVSNREIQQIALAPTVNLSSSSTAGDSKTQKFTIPTVYQVHNDEGQYDEAEANLATDTLLQRLELPNLPGIEALLSLRRRPSTHLRQSDKSLLAQAISKWLSELPSNVRAQLPANDNDLLRTCSWTYTIYAPMLLLPQTFLSKDPWPELLAGLLKTHLLGLYESICQKLKVTHIAINAPIPALVPNSSSNAESETNILRSPTSLVPLHGDFGNPNLQPSKRNFNDAFWVSTVQNNITQVWAPLYTMFSRGNISEKTRLLKIKSLPMPSTSERGLQARPSKVSAVDLYAGIGYFAFSYAKAGVSKVLCWELNGWSIEGLRRGASKNGWSAKIVGNVQRRYSHDEGPEDSHRIGDERLLVFHESNINAASRVRDTRTKIPPIRHVNCGYLPSSSDSWDIAIQVLDPVEGGLIHAHENVATKDIEQRRSEIVAIFRSSVNRYHTPGSPLPRFSVKCQHVERIKAYAPGVMHCVFDISIMPTTSQAAEINHTNATTLT